MKKLKNIFWIDLELFIVLHAFCLRINFGKMFLFRAQNKNLNNGVLLDDSNKLCVQELGRAAIL